jgi:hypothetical protein
MVLSVDASLHDGIGRRLADGMVGPAHADDDDDGGGGGGGGAEVVEAQVAEVAPVTDPSARARSMRSRRVMQPRI